MSEPWRSPWIVPETSRQCESPCSTCYPPSPSCSSSPSSPSSPSRPSCPSCPSSQSGHSEVEFVSSSAKHQHLHNQAMSLTYSMLRVAGLELASTTGTPDLPEKVTCSSRALSSESTRSQSTDQFDGGCMMKPLNTLQEGIETLPWKSEELEVAEILAYLLPRRTCQYLESPLLNQSYQPKAHSRDARQCRRRESCHQAIDGLGNFTLSSCNEPVRRIPGQYQVPADSNRPGFEIIVLVEGKQELKIFHQNMSSKYSISSIPLKDHVKIVFCNS